MIKLPMAKRIAIFYGGGLRQQLIDIKNCGSDIGVDIQLVNYNSLGFDTKNRGKGLTIRSAIELDEYGVVYFRNTKNYWEEVNLILDSVAKDTIVIDPILKSGRPTDVCKVHQMWLLDKNGLNVPRSIFGNLSYLRKHGVGRIGYPLILKGSKGDRRTQVFKFFNDESWLKGIDLFEYREKYENQRYMLQEYIENDRDYRVMVVGGKVLGVMERAAGDNPRLKNVFNKTELTREVLEKAVEAAKVCGISIAGVDVVFKKGVKQPYFWEVNRAPNYSRFEEVTQINVADEIAKYLGSLLSS